MMKSVMAAVLFVGISSSAFAQEDWQVEQQEWQAQVETMSTLGLSVTLAKQLAAKILVCGASNTIVGVSIVADTVPVANILSEIAANMADEDYESLVAEEWSGTVEELFEGTFAGAGALVQDSAQFLVLVLAGEEERAWQNVAASYKSSVILAEKFAEDKSLCSRVSRWEATTRGELAKRWAGENVTVPMPQQNAPLIFRP